MASTPSRHSDRRQSEMPHPIERDAKRDAPSPSTWPAALLATVLGSALLAHRVEYVIGAKRGSSPLAHVTCEDCFLHLAQVHHDQPIQGVSEVPVHIERE